MGCPVRPCTVRASKPINVQNITEGFGLRQHDPANPNLHVSVAFRATLRLENLRLLESPAPTKLQKNPVAAQADLLLRLLIKL